MQKSPKYFNLKSGQIYPPLTPCDRAKKAALNGVNVWIEQQFIPIYYHKYWHTKIPFQSKNGLKWKLVISVCVEIRLWIQATILINKSFSNLIRHVLAIQVIDLTCSSISNHSNLCNFVFIINVLYICLYKKDRN